MNTRAPEEGAPLLPLPRTRRRWLVGALLVGTFLSSIEVMVVSPAMPNVVREFGGAGLYPWVFAAYIGCQTLTVPIYGKLADAWGRRPTYLLGVALFVAGSLACAMCTSMTQMVAGRALQGLGAGALVTLTITIFGDLYNVGDRTKMQGVFSLIWGVSSLLGPAAGGWITMAWSWRGIFWINVVPGLIAAIVVGSLLPGGSPGGTRTPPPAWDLLANRTQQVLLAAGPLIGASIIGLVGYLPVHIQAVKGGTALDAGIALIPMSVMWTVGAVICGRVIEPMGFARTARLGVALSLVGATIAAMWTAHPVGLIFFGMGMGFTISTFNVAAQEAAPPALRGTATSWGLFTRSMGSTIAVPLFGLLAGFAIDVVDFSEIANLELGVAHIFDAMAACMALATAIVWLGFPR